MIFLTNALESQKKYKESLKGPGSRRGQLRYVVPLGDIGV